MKTFIAALAAVALAEDGNMMSDYTTVTLVPYASGMTEPSTTQGMMMAKYASEDHNGMMKWCWEFTVQSKANVALANNNYLCWYLGFPTTADSMKHQTMAECATYNTSTMMFNDDMAVMNYVWTYSTSSVTRSQVNSATTSWLGGSTMMVDMPWEAYEMPSIEEMTNGSSQMYMQYMANAKRNFTDDLGNLTIAANGKYMAYGAYYTWASSAANQSMKDGMYGQAVEVMVLEVSMSATNLATAAAVALAATMAF